MAKKILTFSPGLTQMRQPGQKFSSSIQVVHNL